MNIDDEDYVEKISEWIDSLEDIDLDTIDDSKHICLFAVNYPPFEGLMIFVTEIEGKKAVLFYKRFSFLKVYFPKKIERSFIKNYYKTMLSIKTEKFWAYDEKISFLRTVSFGMDMTMPFLEQQDWKEL